MRLVTEIGLNRIVFKPIIFLTDIHITEHVIISVIGQFMKEDIKGS